MLCLLHTGLHCRGEQTELGIAEAVDGFEKLLVGADFHGHSGPTEAALQDDFRGAYPCGRLCLTILHDLGEHFD